MLIHSSLEDSPSYGRTYIILHVGSVSSLMHSGRWNKKDNNSVTTYNMTDIERNIGPSMNRDGMILFGLLSGADYNKVLLFPLSSPALQYN
jgi:hypothetical protein